MLFNSKHLLAATLVTLGCFLFSCTEDPPPVEEPVQPEEIQETDPPPMEEPVADFVPETIYFAFDDYTLSMEAQQRLTALTDHLSAAGGAVVQVEGHCDERGSIEYNLALGERRAQSVKDYLVQLGVDPARLSTISYGEEKPAMEGHDETAWGRNRRAEFVLTNN